eukprot:6375665-Prymnesium_polylepis.1
MAWPWARTGGAKQVPAAAPPDSPAPPTHTHASTRLKRPRHVSSARRNGLVETGGLGGWARVSTL